MTELDFKDWLAHHMARFPAAAKWLSDKPEESTVAHQPTQRMIIAAWRGVLRDVELRHAKQASDDLAAGKADFHDRTYDCHPRTVRAISQKLSGQIVQQKRQKLINGEATYDCPVGCLDSGLITIWHPTALKFFLENFSPASPPRRVDGVIDWKSWWADVRWREARKCGVYESAAVRCSCPAGMLKRSPSPHYDPQKHVLYDHGDVKKAITRTEAILSARGGF